MTHVYLRQQAQPLWSTVVPRSTVESVSATERKRQEIIFELIYTEANYVKDLNYVNLASTYAKHLRIIAAPLTLTYFI